MGIPGLWDILRPAGKSRSLTHLTVVDGFLRNSSGKRAYRIGIDASIWFFHANGGQGGENPELRTLYFRCCRLLSLPILPLFVFDGALRPSQKRGKHIGKNQHWLVSGMREIIDAFGFEWWTAPGEAEAELAYFNDIGVIDAILSDDVDNFLFGAKVVIRNPSATLTGTQTHVRKTGQEEKDDGQHVVIYRAADIESHPDVGLRRGGLILIGLMSGGDYNTTGLMGIGTSIAHALAKCGYGDQLVDHLEQLKDNKSHIPIALEAWREAVRRDLRGPSRVTELLKRRFPAKAKAITDDFPVIQDVCSYAAPVTSFTLNRDITMIQWTKKPNLGKIAGLCERHFEWGVREVIIKRFRTTVWQGAVLRALIGAVLKQDEKSTPTSTPRKRPSPNVPVTPSTRLADAFRQLHATSPSRPTQPGQASTQEALVSNVSHGGKASETIANIDVSKLILRIHSSRTHPSTDDMLEYRLEIDPGQLVTQAHTGIQDTRLGPDAILDPNFEDLDSDEEGAQKAKKPPPDPLSTLRIWTPAVIVKMACPELVEEFEALQEAKAAKKATKAPKKRAATAPSRTTASITDWALPVCPKESSRTSPHPKHPISVSSHASTSTKTNSTNTLLFPVSKSTLKPTSKSRSATAPGPLPHHIDDPFLDYMSSDNGEPPLSHNPDNSRAHPDPFEYLSNTAKDKATATRKSHDKPEGPKKRLVSVAPSDSDDRSRHAPISRKAKVHRSPRKIPLPSDSSDDDLPSRPESPLATRCQPVRLGENGRVALTKPATAEVIVISSDDETPHPGRAAPTIHKPVSKVVFPLLPPAHKPVGQRDFSEVEVIDLT